MKIVRYARAAASILVGVSFGAYLFLDEWFFTTPANHHPDGTRNIQYNWHGAFYYLTPTEDLTMRVLLAITAVSMVCAFTLSIWLGDWRKKTRRPRGTAPTNWPPTASRAAPDPGAGGRRRRS